MGGEVEAGNMILLQIYSSQGHVWGRLFRALAYGGTVEIRLDFLD